MFWLWIAYGLLAVGIILFGILFVRKLRRHLRGEALSLSDYVAIAGTVLNIVILLLAVGSLHVAITTYVDAKNSGEEQAKTLKQQETSLQASRDALDKVVTNLGQQSKILDASRAALDSSVKTALAQQKLLTESVENSRKQLQILQAEWSRELEQPDIEGILVSAENPALVLRNISKVKPVKNGLYQLILLNLDHWQGSHFALAETTATPIDFVAPDDQYLPAVLHIIAPPGDPAPVKGDRLFGYLSMHCAECKSHKVYWVYLKYQEQGWYVKANGTEYPIYELKPGNIDSLISAFLARHDLVPFAEKWP